MHTKQIEPLLTIPQAAAVLGVKPKRMYDLAKRLPPGVVLKLGGSVRVHRKRLEAWLASGGHLSR